MSQSVLGQDFAQQAMKNGRVALMIGNGVNLFPGTSDIMSWSRMVETLARTSSTLTQPPPEDLAQTELFDLITLAGFEKKIVSKLQNKLRADLWSHEPTEHHYYLMEWAKQNRTPVITTNFDKTLATAAGAQLRSMFKKQASIRKPTDYYPWEKYFSPEELNDPCEGFGIWHVNGLVDHPRSISLGLSQYMGSVSRARTWLYGPKVKKLFHKANQANWRGHNTWLHIFFNMPLLIFGLELGQQEVFIRWLLIQRSRYFQMFEERRQPAWYVYPSNDKLNEGKLYFLEHVGIQPCEVDCFKKIYNRDVWRLSAP
jgi:hypothetical protein